MIEFRPISGRLKMMPAQSLVSQAAGKEKGFDHIGGVGVVGKERGRGEAGGLDHADSSRNSAIWECTLVP